VKTLIKELNGNGANVVVVDPFVSNEEIEKYGVKSEKDIYKALKQSDALVIMTAHDDFKELDLDRIYEIMETRIFIDGRRIYDPKEIVEKGFVYRGIGRGKRA
jgi:UDP-glucose 6-dehydrogenase